MTNINYEEMLNLIQSEIVDYMRTAEESEEYSDYRIVLSSEQQFMKIKDKDPRNIYIVVKFGATSILFGQIVLPITLTILSEQNKLITTQKLMAGFTETYNLQRNEEGTLQQIWENPSVSNNFNPIYEGWRSIIRVTGVFAITKNAAYYDVTYTHTNSDGTKVEQKIPAVSINLGLANNPDSQPFYNTYDFTHSVITMGHFTLQMSMFLLNNNMIASKIIDMITGSTTDFATDGNGELQPIFNRDEYGKQIEDWQTSINNTFELDIKFLDGRVRHSKMKLINFHINQEIGKIPLFIGSFSE